MRQLTDGNYLMAAPNFRAQPVEVFTHNGRQMVAVRGGEYALAELMDTGYTFAPLVAMTPERVAALEAVAACADMGQGDEVGDNSALGIVRKMLVEAKGVDDAR